MDSSFNPYLKWLGIPLKDQPPNNYRLLGLELFETEPDIIERAADRQMTYLRSLQSGEHSALAQRLLNEVAAAKVSLLDPQKKGNYDRKLRMQLQEVKLRPKTAPEQTSVQMPLVESQPSSAQAPLPTPPAMSRPSQAPASAPAAANVPILVAPAAGKSATAPRTHVASRARRQNSALAPVLIALGGSAAVLLVVGLLAASLLSSAGSDDRNLVRVDEDKGRHSKPTSPPAGGGKNGENETNSKNTNTGKNNSSVDTQSTDSTDSGAANSAKNTGAELSIEAPFILGNLEDGKKVLSDRPFTFADLDEKLQSLEFTRWRFGPVSSFEFDVQRPGAVYMILPPRNYAEPLPERIVVRGWEATSLQCNVQLEDGSKLACAVYKQNATDGSTAVPVSTSIWPLIAAHTIVKRRRTLDDIVQNETGNGTGWQRPEENGSADKVDVDSPTVAKLPVPSNAEQQDFHTRITELFELSDSKPIEKSQADARRMLEVGRKPSDDPTERYVILATAARVAAASGDLIAALESVQAIDSAYEADSAAMRLYLVQRFVKSRATKNVKAAQLAQVISVLDEALAGDRFEEVDTIVTDLSGEGISHKELADRRRIARKMKETYRQVAAAKETLASDPDDAKANQIVGEYVCYQKLSWDDGLPMLAKSADPDLSELAQLDLQQPEDGKSQFAIARGWDKLAQSDHDDDQVKGALLSRARGWYGKAHEDVSGLDQVTAKKRLDEIKEELDSLGWVDPEERDAPRKAVIAARSGYEFYMYLNGELIINSDYRQVGTAAVTLKRGDILMVKASRSTSSSTSSGYGFACVIAFEGSTKPLVTGSVEGWTGYVPSDTYTWFKPESVARTLPVVFSPGPGHQDLIQQTGARARSMWYATDNSSTGYFLFRVP